jgi:hypothetical protein
VDNHCLRPLHAILISPVSTATQAAACRVLASVFRDCKYVFLIVITCTDKNRQKFVNNISNGNVLAELLPIPDLELQNAALDALTILATDSEFLLLCYVNNCLGKIVIDICSFIYFPMVLQFLASSNADTRAKAILFISRLGLNGEFFYCYVE